MKKMMRRTWTTRDSRGCEFIAHMWQNSDGSGRKYACLSLGLESDSLRGLKDKVSKWGR